MSGGDSVETKSGVKSVETAARLLVAMRSSRGSETLKDIAERAEMHPAKAHRYLVSLIRVGLVHKDEESGRYRWGPLAIDIGAAAIRNINLVRAGVHEVKMLRDTLDVTVALAVWGTFGPTQVLVEEADREVMIRSQVGSVLPLLTSATGRVFAAFSETPEVQHQLENEIYEAAPSAADRARTEKEFKSLCDKIRSDGVAQSVGEFYSGIIALSCPVYNYRNTLSGAITILSHQGDFDATLNGHVAQELRACSERLSRDIGYLPE